ncbi:MAG: beta-hydroxyacyl-ACP dehydratase [Planctomycetes bacterium]|nr:beta-hydroxyacyl-ACP dehydratase [Planctomycetota bacterium]
MSRHTIENSIPHRESMLLLDEIVSRSADRIVCRKTFRPDEFFLRGHYPGYPLVPGVILCECAMQAGAVLLSELAPRGDRVPVATRMNDVRWKRMVRPGETIDIDVRLDERLADAFFLSARITRDGDQVARLAFACALAAREDP